MIPIRIGYARFAGLLYLLIICCGLFSELFVRAELILKEDAGATANSILTSSALFRAGFAADSIMLLADVAIAVIFYILFRRVSQTLSLMAAAFQMIQASILGVSLLFYYTALLLLTDVGMSGALSQQQTNEVVLLLLKMHGHGYDLGLLFFAISTMVLGYLMIRSQSFPTLLGYGLVGAAGVYLLGSYTRFLLPDYLPLVEPLYVIPIIAESAFCVWLLTRRAAERE